MKLTKPLKDMGGQHIRISNISFTESSKEQILDLLDKKIDSEGFIVEKNAQNHKVVTRDGIDLNIDDWAGVHHGSEVFVKKDGFSLLNLAKKINL